VSQSTIILGDKPNKYANFIDRNVVHLTDIFPLISLPDVWPVHCVYC